MAGVLFAARHEQRWVSKSSLLPDEPNDLTNPVSNGDDDDDDDAHRGCLRESSHDDWVVCSFEDSHIHVWTGFVLLRFFIDFAVGKQSFRGEGYTLVAFLFCARIVKFL